MSAVAVSALPHLKRNTLCTAVALAIMASSAPVLAQQDSPALEEVIVTGSFIRRSEGFTAASPVMQMDAEDLQAEGTVNMAQVVQNMTFNSGTAVTNSIQGVTDNNPAFNLRGLGTRATLQLVDGKRSTTNNVNALLPDIAIQRIDIVTDGAAALYGSDAVAGVVNMIPYTTFEGLTMEYYQEGDTRGDYVEYQVGILAGRQISNSIHVVGAASFRDQGTLRWLDRPSLLTSGLTQNSGANPGNFVAPVRDAEGNLTGASAGRPDPTCGLIVEDPRQMGANPYGVLFGGRCWQDFGDTRDFRSDQDISQFYGNLEFDPSADFSISAQLLYSRKLRNTRENRGNPGGRVAELPIVRGEIPGNTFRAMTADSRELYAVPLRDDSGNLVTDGYGRPLPLRGDDGNVVLAENRFLPLSQDPLGGVPFYEDVQLNAWLPFGKTSTLPTGFNPDGTNPAFRDDRDLRLSLSSTFSVPFMTEWQGMANYTYARTEDRGRANQSFSYSAIRDGLNCDVINDVDACFNPFGVVDPRFANSQAVADAVWTNYARRNEDELQVYDLVFSGDVGDVGLPGGTIAAAFGYQRREEKLRDVPPIGNLTNDQFIGTRGAPVYGSRFVNALFLELSVPVLDNLELSGAIRNENFSTGQEDTIAKLGFVYEPFDWLGVRATWGEAFIAPTIRQLQSPEICGLSNVNDPFTTFQGFVTSCNQGNPNLRSESSTSLSAGIDLIPMDGMTVSLTWSETDFRDRIVSTTTEDIIRTDFARFQEATGWQPATSGELPPLSLLQQWVNDSRSDNRITRVPGNIETVQRIQQSDSNASTMLVRAWDGRFGYNLPFRDWGTFRFGVQGTYVDTYRFQMGITDPVREAAGNQNNPFGAVPAMPRWRANARMGWSRGNHSFNTTVRYVHSVNFDASDFSFQQFFPFSTFRQVDEIRAWTQADMFYSYRGLSMPGLGGELDLTLGSRNVFDREAQKTGMIAGVAAELQDPLGRVVYGRVQYNF